MNHPSTTLAIVFADVSGSTRLFEELGDEEASRIMARALAVMTEAAAREGGTLRLTMGDEVFCTFTEAAAGLSGVLEIMKRVEEDPLLASHRIAVRVGLHVGPVLEAPDGIFGDAINLAARLASMARAGQIITTKSTAGALPPGSEPFFRPLAPVTVRGKRDPIEICEILWRQDVTALTTVIGGTRTHGPAEPRLALRYRDREVTIGHDDLPFVLGRGAECDLTVDFRQVSRAHATIERRGRTFALRDHSTNGTYVRVGEGRPIFLHRNHLHLQLGGTIELGRGEDAVAHAVHFDCLS